MDIGRALREARTHRRLTQQALEHLTGVSTSVISRIESGQIASPSIDIVARLCHALSVSIDEMCHRGGFTVQAQSARRGGEAARLRELWEQLRRAGRRLKRARLAARAALEEIEAAYSGARRVYRKSRAPHRHAETDDEVDHPHRAAVQPCSLASHARTARLVRLASGGAGQVATTVSGHSAATMSPFRSHSCDCDTNRGAHGLPCVRRFEDAGGRVVAYDGSVLDFELRRNTLELLRRGPESSRLDVREPLPEQAGPRDEIDLERPRSMRTDLMRAPIGWKEYLPRLCGRKVDFFPHRH